MLSDEEKEAIKVINKRTERLLDELTIGKENFTDEPKIAYLMQEIRRNKTMLSDEEKEAITVIKKKTERLLDELTIEKENFTDEPKIAYLMQEIRANKTILNLIEKQSKEIEKLKTKKYIFNAKTGEIKQIPLDDNYISKDKIKQVIQHEIEMLQSLLEKE